ncbi:hypothetical protein CEXT_583941 [Caerostris extrusa]|uniref:Uncharacterized protein n=1 Tax=Caerostris extrusa TaxID=172846 RepID=A0AAV4S0W0_CAEEX|nr:hypothetical protein CEXT_583941 [Caerostris extrusa]
MDGIQSSAFSKVKKYSHLVECWTFVRDAQPVLNVNLLLLNAYIKVSNLCSEVSPDYLKYLEYLVEIFNGTCLCIKNDFAALSELMEHFLECIKACEYGEMFETYEDLLEVIKETDEHLVRCKKHFDEFIAMRERILAIINF